MIAMLLLTILGHVQPTNYIPKETREAIKAELNRCGEIKVEIASDMLRLIKKDRPILLDSAQRDRWADIVKYYNRRFDARRDELDRIKKHLESHCPKHFRWYTLHVGVANTHLWQAYMEADKLDQKDMLLHVNLVIENFDAWKKEHAERLQTWNASKEHERMIRTWTDKTGKFAVIAEFLACEKGDVKLKRIDGKKISVRIHKLSKEDREWVIAEYNKEKKNGDE